MKIEYVASGLSFTRLNNITDEKLASRVNNWIQKLKENHRFAFLFNAYQEEKYVDFLKYYDLPIYADSGGLQMMTKGVDITKERKEKVYKTQTFSNYAFCMDETPIKRIDKRKRVVYKDLFYEKGVITGKNIKEQINYFREHNAKSRVFIIIQGQELEDYQNYLKGILTQIDENDYDYIEGLAYSSACSGNAMYSTFKTSLSCIEMQKLDLPERIKKRVHFLGFGSVKRFVVIKSILGHFDNGFDISADSTSLTMGYFMGIYQAKNDKKFSMRRYSEEYLDETKDSVLELIFSDMKEFIKKYELDIDDEEFDKIRRVFIKGTYIQASKLPGDEKEYLSISIFLFFLAQVDNLMEASENLDYKDLNILPEMIFETDDIYEMDKLYNRILGKPNGLHQRINFNNKKADRFNDLF